jgi:8-hydroxy-5-deazaflavin:NADPH oxidoreductase
MKAGILGTGMVGKTIGTKLAQLGYEVKMGSRTANNEKAAEWVTSVGTNASQGTFAEAAAFGEIVFNCTSGMASLDALKLVSAANLSGKILVDVANPLDFSKGMPPSLSVCNTDSLGEQIQREYPSAKVVKTLNTTNCVVMVNPSLVPGEHDMFICGNDSEAKAEVLKILKGLFGWKSVIDLGDITAARCMEMLLPIWIRLMGVYKSPNFNFKIAK